MSVTTDGVRAAFVVLDRCNKRRPDTWSAAGMAGVVDTWVAMLPDVDDEQLLVAATRYGRSSTPFWPSLGELLAMVPDRTPRADAWSEAWGRIVEGFGRHGRNNPPGDRWRLSDRDDEHRAGLHALRAVGGWRVLCDSQESELGYSRTTFERVFKARIESQAEEQDWMCARDLIAAAQRRRIDHQGR